MQLPRSVAKLDPARLKPGCKVSVTDKFRIPRVKDEDEDESLKQRARCDTRAHKIQHELERLGIGAEFLHANGLGLFYLAALGHLMRWVSSPLLLLLPLRLSICVVEIAADGRVVLTRVGYTPAWTGRALWASQSPSRRK